MAELHPRPYRHGDRAGLGLIAAATAPAGAQLSLCLSMGGTDVTSSKADLPLRTGRLSVGGVALIPTYSHWACVCPPPHTHIPTHCTAAKPPAPRAHSHYAPALLFCRDKRLFQALPTVDVATDVKVIGKCVFLLAV